MVLGVSEWGGIEGAVQETEIWCLKLAVSSPPVLPLSALYT